VGIYNDANSVEVISVDFCDTYYPLDGSACTETGPITYCAVDRDGDGLPDDWELAKFGNLSQTAAGDYDSDGVSNYLEYVLGRNPAAGASADSSGLTALKVYTPLR
jgi:hypothetical protein